MPQSNGEKVQRKVAASPSSKPDIAEQEWELAHVRHIGPTRARALADAGIITLEHLINAELAEIGSVKWVGMRNAQRIKDWVHSQTLSNKENPDPELAAVNQTIQDEMSEIDSSITQIHNRIPQRIWHKKLDRQIDKLLAVLSELAEGPDTLRPKQIRRILKMLHLISALLETISSAEKMTEKTITAFADELRDRRKRLQKTIDPKS